MYLLGLSGLAVLLAAGILYGHWAKKYETIASIPLLPSIPLGTFPMTLGQWQGRDVPINETVLKVAGNDDHLSRFYTNSQMKMGASLYVGYTAEPRRMLGHRPQVCYVGNGWTHDYTDQEIIRSTKGIERECLIHRFYKHGLMYEEVFVLNYYVINGRVTTDQREFEGLWWRRPKQTGGRLQYVAQIQISSSSEQAVRLFAQEATDQLMEYMP
ncbi:MAG: hypothetical protein A4E53_00899 [Pelotomaculum sp. PtaB.Bin104]|nr:MAG: hypothetical protein A4E53_00899 [Pelotomaculum sp. PtaB.Bin104]